MLLLSYFGYTILYLFCRWIGGPRYTITSDPAVVEYVLKTRFENFPKGNYVYNIMKDLFGDGIFAVDGEKWVSQRKTASHMFAAREFREVSQGFSHKLIISVQPCPVYPAQRSEYHECLSSPWR